MATIRFTPRTALVLLALLSALPYLVTLHHPFVYDDHGQIEENPFLRNPERLRDVVTLATAGQPHVINGRRPLVLATYFLDRALWGDLAAGYRFTNLLLHVACVLLFFGLLRRLATPAGDRDRAGRFAFTAALLFGLHPLATEAVHVPSFRPDLLYSVFVLVFLRIGLTLPETYSLNWLGRIAAGALCLGGALVSKEAGLIAPLMLGLVWWCFPATRPERGTIRLVPLLSLAVAVGFALACRGGAPLQAATGLWNGQSLWFPSNLLTSPWLLLRYLGLLVWPHPLVADRVVEPITTLLSARFAAGILASAGLAVLAVTARRSRPWAALGAGWILIGYAPVSNLVPLFNPMADRYAYFLIMGFATLLGALVWTTTLRLGTDRARWTAVILMALVGLGVSLARLADWRDDATLWRTTLQQEPRSARAHIWSGLAAKRDGRLDEALRCFATAEQLNPQAVAALVNEAIILGQRGDLAGAEARLREALRRRPDYAEAHVNLAVDLQLQDRADEAVAALEAALKLDPLHLRALESLAGIAVERGDFRTAAPYVERLREADPASPAARELGEELKRNLPAPAGP